MVTNLQDQSLRGVGVLVTRPARQAEKLIGLIDARGGTTIPWPTLAIVAPDDLAPAIAVVDHLADYDVAVFISTNAVEHGLELIRVQNQGIDHLSVVAVGEATAEKLRREGLEPTVPSLESGTEGLLALPVFWTPAINGKRVVIFRGVGGRETLGETLLARGAQVDYAEVYQRIKPPANPDTLKTALDRKAVNVVLATSAAGLQNLDELAGSKLRERLHELPLLVMSERMAVMAGELGYDDNLLMVVSDASDSGIIDTLVEWNNGRQDPASATDSAASETNGHEPESGGESVTNSDVNQGGQISSPRDILLRASEPLVTEAEETLAGMANGINLEESTPTYDTASDPADNPKHPFLTAESEHQDHDTSSSSKQQDVGATQTSHSVPESDPQQAPEPAPILVESATAIPAVVTPPPSRTGWPAWLALTLGAGALGYQLYWTQVVYPSSASTQKTQVESMRGDLETLRGKVPESDKLRSEITALAEKETSQLQTLTAGLEQLSQEQKTLSTAVTAIESRTPQDAADWVLAEVDYLLLAADERLQNGQDVKAALAAMRTADARLQSLARPNLKPVREQLVKDMTDVRSMKQVDVSELSLYFGDLVDRVDTLPLKGGEIVTKPSPELTKPSATDTESTGLHFKSMAKAIWQDLTSLVKIEDTNLSDSKTFEPEFRYFLQQHLRLEIAGARLDLVRRNVADLKASTGMIKNLLNRFYDTDSEAVRSIMARLDEAAALDLTPQIPDITKSLQMLREYREHPAAGTAVGHSAEPSAQSATNSGSGKDENDSKGNQP